MSIIISILKPIAIADSLVPTRLLGFVWVLCEAIALNPPKIKTVIYIRLIYSQ
ncbi:MAG: hypothetical protein IM585_14470 [Pseudanabaena sp. M135S2SP2A07QC]|nr:hypothetical protein [Pseudanabaena sp. M051S1SP2A07QC]MCA6525817.1 hypothetical protein [Pseudanabaena sp. M179S2SP2A07QC]MCA6531588.1 hypothetical protein [Pseudanabaena sp. M125S2SP2A07QC]MCA6533459.1 hypothetical protein [Pseudanabaena sp. M176S2SP2A07QC]MCA6539150.1 hypothetical protein [Pseudanabaena sp. M037S2SP2A07QC]MCA6542520.1 hypothetical protein [Pseudanabaena sp. M074S1SP2A07QC]MCA6548893.1 hypothetical protein [Pseudanabaena sp. M152S2SP2A07QC]MCA6553161.1 hypothetical prot